MKPLLRLVLPKQPRTRCVVMNNEEILLVQNWLGKQDWTLPGGGIRLKELPENSAKREVQEELNITLDVVKPLGSYECNEDGLKINYLLFGAHINQKEFQPRKGEIINARWFKVSTLPKAKSSVVQEAINRFEEL